MLKLDNVCLLVPKGADLPSYMHFDKYDMAMDGFLQLVYAIEQVESNKTVLLVATYDQTLVIREMFDHIDIPFVALGSLQCDYTPSEWSEATSFLPSISLLEVESQLQDLNNEKAVAGQKLRFTVDDIEEEEEDE